MTRYVGATQAEEFPDGASARRDLHDYLAYVLKAIESVSQSELVCYYGDPGRLSARTSSALVELMKGLTLSDLQRLVLRWHEAFRYLDGTELERQLSMALNRGIEIPRHSVATAPTRETVEPIFSPTALPRSGYHVEQLVELEDLHREGIEMQHCVVSYAGRAARGQCLLVRLRHPVGIKRATLEFRFVVTMAGGKWQLEQAKARKNQNPDQETTVAAAECLQYLNQVSSHLAPERLAPFVVVPGSDSAGYPDFVVLEALLDSNLGRRWLPGPSAMNLRERLHLAFGTSSMPMIQL
jgi:hypothetical protein